MIPLLQTIIRRLKRLPAYLTIVEKVLIVGLTIVSIVSATRIVIIKNSPRVADYGGTFTEAIVASSPKQIQDATVTLDHRGLVALSVDDKVLPSLAKSWTESSNGKEYIFTLQDHVDADVVVAAVRSATDKLGKLDVAKTSDNQITIKLAQPFAPLLKNLSQPFVPIGPFTIVSKNSNSLTYQANRDYPLKPPYFDKVVIKVVSSSDEQQQLLKKNKASAALGSFGLTTDFSRLNFSLDSQPVVFFNNAKPELQNASVRSSIIKGEPIDQPFSLTLKVTNDENSLKLANEVKDRYQKSGIQVNLQPVSAQEMKNNVLPNRDYDAVLVKIETGRDPDPYPFWHSSQISANGQNYANYFNKQADKLLEQERLETDESKRGTELADFQKMLVSDKPADFLPRQVLAYTFNKTIQGVDLQFMDIAGDHFATIENWFSQTKVK